MYDWPFNFQSYSTTTLACGHKHGLFYLRNEMKLLATALVCIWEPCGDRTGQEGNTEDEYNGYVVFKCIIHILYQLGKCLIVRGGGVTPPAPTLFYNKLLDRYLKTMWRCSSISAIWLIFKKNSRPKTTLESVFYHCYYCSNTPVTEIVISAFCAVLSLY